MTLPEWLRRNNETLAGFARRIGASNAKVVERYCKGTRTPEPRVMQRIFAATDGAVTPNDFHQLTHPGTVDAA